MVGQRLVNYENRKKQQAAAAQELKARKEAEEAQQQQQGQQPQAAAAAAAAAGNEGNAEAEPLLDLAEQAALQARRRQEQLPRPLIVDANEELLQGYVDFVCMFMMESLLLYIYLLHMMEPEDPDGEELELEQQQQQAANEGNEGEGDENATPRARRGGALNFQVGTTLSFSCFSFLNITLATIVCYIFFAYRTQNCMIF